MWEYQAPNCGCEPPLNRGPLYQPSSGRIRSKLLSLTMKHTVKPELQTVTVEFGGGLDSGLCWGKLAVLFLSPATDVLQFITLWAEVQSRFVQVTLYSYLLWLVLRINWILGLLYKERLNKWRSVERSWSDKNLCSWQTLKKKLIPSAAITSLMGLYPRSAGKLHSLDDKHCKNVVDIKISSLFKGNSNQLVNSDTHQPTEPYADFSICKTELRIFLSYQGSQYKHTALPVFTP
jgi:hypothetical protein